MEPAPGNDIDPAYLQRLRARSDALFSSVVLSRERALRTKRGASRMRTDLDEEFRAMHRDLASLEDETRASMQRVRAVLAQLGAVAKRPQLQRLQSRTDAWAPEKRMSRESFRLMLEDEMSARQTPRA